MITKLHEAIASARGVDPRHPGLPFMEAAAELLEEHEQILAILSTHIIPERCKPQQPRCVRCGESAQYGRIYCERCVASRTTGNLDALKPPGPTPEEERPDGRWCERCVRCHLPITRGRLYCERCVPVAKGPGPELVGAFGEWNAERGRLMAERDEALKRVEQARQEGLDEGIARSWEAAAKDVDALNKGEEESKGEGGCTGTAQEPGAPASPAGDGVREASSPTLSLRVEAALRQWGDDLSDSRSQEEVIYPILDAWEVRHRKLREAAAVRFNLWHPGIAGAASRQNQGEEGGVGPEPAEVKSGCASSSPAAPSLREEVLAFLDGWGVGAHTTCGDAVSEVLDAWEARHRKLHKAAQAVILEAPKSVCRLRGEGCPGHASILEAVTDRLEAALKEAADATL